MEEQGTWQPLIVAARMMGTSENALRKRITRGSGIRHEKRAGLIYVWVPAEHFTIVSPTTHQSVTTQDVYAVYQRLAAATEEHNRLLAKLLETDVEVKKTPKKRRWPWRPSPKSSSP
jgi:hypothetical protein